MATNRRRQTPEPAPAPLGPWPRGMVNTLSDHALPPDALLDAVDCTIDREGFVYSRPSYNLLDDTSSYKHLYELNGTHYAFSGGSVGILGPDGFISIRASVGPIGWTELKGAPVFCDNDGVYQIQGGSAVQFTARTSTPDEERYGLTDLPGGKAVAYWQGRLLVLRGRSLIWSEAMDYGSFSPSRNFLRFPTTPTWMAALPTGVFVGLREQVVFLAGTDPAQFTMREVAGVSCPGASIVMDSKHLDPSLGGGELVAVWFSEVGFVVGRADGSVIYPQATSLRNLPIVPRTISLINERLYAFADEE